MFRIDPGLQEQARKTLASISRLVDEIKDNVSPIAGAIKEALAKHNNPKEKVQ